VKLLATNRLTWLVSMAKPASKIGSFSSRLYVFDLCRQ
jgi:hypothetical protein